MIDLKNINIILTGATGGIGSSILGMLNNVNANIIASGTNTIKLEKLKEKFNKVSFKKFDISNHSEIEKFIEECNEHFENKIDVLINNAGVTADNLAIRMKDEEWNKVININLTSSFLLSKHAIKKMLKHKRGKIINITSVVGHTGNVGQTNYAATKSALIGFSKSLALEGAGKGITSNVIAPGYINTEMVAAIREDILNKIIETIPTKRLGSSEEIADMVLYLASDKSSYINGATFSVNGGLWMD